MATAIYYADTEYRDEDRTARDLEERLYFVQQIDAKCSLQYIPRDWLLRFPEKLVLRKLSGCLARIFCLQDRVSCRRVYE